MLLGEPIFVGNHNDELLENITDVMGRPTRKQVFHMNPHWCKQGKWKTYVLADATVQTDFLRQQFGNERYDDGQTIPESFIQLMREFFVYNPGERCTCFDVLTHSWFDELRAPNFEIKDLDVLPPLFEFTDDEIREATELDILQDLQPLTETITGDSQDEGSSGGLTTNSVDVD